ncbi:lipase 3 [Anabrus simplex]|uniref:lipase 3 n=1 Tax=Anabrus simplex TaxID=316456 RepID=UPI0035A2B796
MAMAARFICIVAVCLLGVNAAPSQKLQDEVLDEAKMDTPQLLKKHGYPVEIHEVITDDDYILTMHRVPYSPVSPLVDGTKKPPILVQHGLLSSSADWVLMGPGIGYAYILADAGYDVWLGNCRGNTYSKRHKTLDVNSDEFWDFSWHENGIHDVPAEINYILNVTGEEKLFYAGHSMGTTMFYVMCSERPEYNDKIRAMFSLAPIAYMNHMTSPFFKLFSKGEAFIAVILKLLGIKEFLPNNELMDLAGKVLCKDGAIFQKVCSDVLFLIAGYDSKELNETMLPSIIAHTPAGASVKQLLHYAQEINSGSLFDPGHFRQYDYGIFGNKAKYGQWSPPDYDLSKITAPVYLLYSENDWLAGLRDIQRLFDGLPNAHKYDVPLHSFNHLDFLWAIDANQLVYSETVKIMKDY